MEAWSPLLPAGLETPNAKVARLLQPDSSPIWQDQLAAEVKGIYSVLFMVEAKCINVDAAQAAELSLQLALEQEQAWIA